jgi:hypothetical protein
MKVIAKSLPILNLWSENGFHITCRTRVGACRSSSKDRARQMTFSTHLDDLIYLVVAFIYSALKI